MDKIYSIGSLVLGTIIIGYVLLLSIAYVLM